MGRGAPVIVDRRARMHRVADPEIVGTADHLALRREYARPLFIALLRLARELRRAHGPKTLLGRAASSLRIVALGRKKFMFVHSEEAGKELALLYSLVVSCTRLGVNPVDYLADVLDRIDKTADDGMRELLPDRWKPPAKPATATDFVA